MAKVEPGPVSPTPATGEPVRMMAQPDEGGDNASRKTRMARFALSAQRARKDADLLATVAKAAHAQKAKAQAGQRPPVTPKIIDLNQRTTIEQMGLSKLFSSRASSRRRGGRYGAEPPPEWAGAAKLVRDLGETVTCVAVSEDDSLFAAGSILPAGHNAMVFSTKTGATVASFKAKSGVNAVCFAGVGKQTLLIAGCMTGDMHLWHVNDGSLYYEHKFIGNVHSMAIGAGGTRLAVGGVATHVVVYCLALPDESTATSLQSPTQMLTELVRFKTAGTVNSLSLCADASVLCTGGDSKLVQLWGLHTPEAIEARAGEPMVAFRCSSTVYSLALSPRCDRLAVGTVDCTDVYQLSPVSEHKIIRPPATPLPRPSPMGSSPTRTLTQAAFGKTRRERIRHDSMTAEQRDVIIAPPATPLPRASPMGSSPTRTLTQAAFGKTRRERIRHDSITAEQRDVIAADCASEQPTPGGTGGAGGGKTVARHAENVVECPGVVLEPLLWLECPAQQGGVAFSQEGKIAVAGDQLVTVFDTVSGATLCKMPRTARVRCCALTSTGSIVVVGGFDKKVTMYNVCAGTEMSHFTCADDSVWSVHLSADSSLLAIGSGQTTNTAKGYVCLYDANAHGPGPTGGTSPGLLARWDHPRVVWCVRLSPDGTVLVAADWNMKMTVYDTHPSQLRQIQQFELFTSMSFSCLGRSMQFSPDNSHLALGCWSGNAHLYRLSRAASGARTAAAGAPAPPSCTPSLSGNFVLGTPKPPPSPLEMYEIARVKRTDRVYAVGLDAHGQHMCVGGRDKTVALYEIEPDGAQHKTSLIWTAVAEDFVYAVAMSADLTYCVYGGTNKAVVVLDGRTGVPDWRVALPGAVWCISMLPDSSRMAVWRAAHSERVRSGQPARRVAVAHGDVNL